MCIAMMGACKCKVCEDGADGKDGVDGAQGPQGQQGIPGNAGVRMYTYGSKSSVPSGWSGSQFTENSITYAIPLAAATLEKSHVYAYGKVGTNTEWYPMVSNNIFNLLTAISGSNYIVYFFTATGGVVQSAVVVSAFRIIVVPIPDENITEVKSAVSIDFDNYGEVAAYYGLPE